MRLKYTFIPFSILLLSLFSSCEDDSSGYDLGAPIPVSFTPMISDNIQPAISTRASGTAWASGDKVGIYMVAHGTGNPTLPGLAGNYQYQTSAAGAKVSLTPVGDPVYYPVNNDTKVNFVAYYPYQSSFTTAHTYPVNVTTQTTLSAIDLLYCSRTSVQNSKNTPNASLTFKHQLVNVKVNVKAGTGVTSTHMTSPTFTITGMPRQATFPLATGTLSAGTDTGNITPYRNTAATGASATNLFWEAILVPNSSGTRSFTFSLGGVTYTYPITQTFTSGTQYEYVLTLSTSGIIVESIEIKDWNVGAAAWDGTYTLTLGESNLTLDAEVTSGSVDAAYNTPVAPVVTSKPSWISSASFVKGSTSGGFTAATLNYTLSANTGGARSGTIQVTAQGLTIPITVTQSAPVTSTLANCYMVAPGNMVVFPVTRAYEAGAIHGTLDTDYKGYFTADVQWQDTDVLDSYYVIGTGETAHVAVRAKSGYTQGNALVTLKNSSGTIVWSYHIWVTTTSPDSGSEMNYGSTNPRTFFMERNLGAYGDSQLLTNGGLFYQWGRKDPFPNTASVSGFSIAAIGQVSIATTIQNPGVFNPYTGDWNSTANAYLWCDANGNKTIYDPCPAGWRVPTSGFGTASPWFGWYEGGAEWKPAGTSPYVIAGYLGGGGFWPAAGYRYYSTGALSYVGSYGRYWGATAYVSTTGCYILSIRSDNVDPSSGIDRSFGNSVRCVSE